MEMVGLGLGLGLGLVLGLVLGLGLGLYLGLGLGLGLCLGLALGLGCVREQAQGSQPGGQRCVLVAVVQEQRVEVAHCACSEPPQCFWGACRARGCGRIRRVSFHEMSSGCSRW